MPAREAAELPGDRQHVRGALIDWYEENKRPIPWRDTRDPYAILVAEVMSQQTQLDRVIPSWEAFLERWPAIEDLADESRGEVIGFWSERRLGYNRRAAYLHAAARRLVADWEGEVPSDPDVLCELKGVGPYTANAVASLAFNAGDAVLDTNVKRVLHRFLPGMSDRADADLDGIANELLPADRSRMWNNAIMELGAVLCGQAPACDEGPCPWRKWCAAYRTGDFTTPDVPQQPRFEGSRRQFRGRIVRHLGEAGPLELDALGHRVRVDYRSAGAHGREWLLDLLADLEDDGLVRIEPAEPTPRIRLAGDSSHV